MVALSLSILFAALSLETETVSIRSSFDGSEQPCGIIASDVKGPQPLLVLLHPWSHGYNTFDYGVWIDEARARGWHVVLPHFRGPNNNPHACASPEARQDVLDAVDYVLDRYDVEPRRIYLAGVSGGGHMAMVMAAHAPKRWAAVSAWCGIADLGAWHAETKAAGLRYWEDIERVIGGPPGASQAVDDQLRLRSPLFHLSAAADVPMDLNAGIHDGHTGSVPIHHSLDALNVLAAAHHAAPIASEMIQKLGNRDVAGLSVIEDSTYGRAIYFRASAGPSRVTIFEGGHEFIAKAACAWLERHARVP